MKEDIIICHLNKHGLLIDTLDNITIDAPVGVIMKINGIYIKCIASTHRMDDCYRCACHPDNGGPTGLCATLKCQVQERSDRTEVHFEVIDTDQRIRKEGKA